MQWLAFGRRTATSQRKEGREEKRHRFSRSGRPRNLSWPVEKRSIQSSAQLLPELFAMDVVRPRSRSPPWRRPPPPLQSPGLGRKPDYYVGTLPSINYLDMEKIKREASEYSPRNPSTTMPAPLQISQLHMYSGPPPPYSYPSSTASSVLGLTGYISPPGSRRTSDDDKEPQAALRQQSLPSIHEALGKDQALLYSSGPPSIVPPAQTSVPVSVHTPTTPVSRSHPDAVLLGPPNPYASSAQPLPYNHEPSDRRAQQAHRKGSQGDDPPLRSSRFATHDLSSQPVDYTAISSPPVRPSPLPMQHQNSSPTYNSVTPHASSVLPQPAYYGQPAYSYPPQMASVLSYQNQGAQPGAWRTDGTETDRAEEIRKAASKRSPPSGHHGGQHYGESVKRHLDIFDLETSLNEVIGQIAMLMDHAKCFAQIADGSGRALDFSRHYGQRAHQASRTGPLPSSLPTLGEVDDMARRQTHVLDSLARIREVIITQQHALAEQRSRDEASKVSSEYGDDGTSYSDKGEGGGGFAGADAKKRRGVRFMPYESSRTNIPIAQCTTWTLS